MASINPYLNFEGNCEEVFNFYKTVIGGEFATVMRFTDMPAETPITESDANKILHIALPIGDGSVLMGSDCMPGFGPPFNAGNNFTVSFSPDSEDDARRIFDGLAAGGTIPMPIGKSFWNSLFGILTDKFGIQWMVNYDYARPA